MPDFYESKYGELVSPQGADSVLFFGSKRVILHPLISNPENWLMSTMADPTNFNPTVGEVKPDHIIGE